MNQALETLLKKRNPKIVINETTLKRINSTLEKIEECLNYLRIKSGADHAALASKNKLIFDYSLQHPFNRLNIAIMEKLVLNLFLLNNQKKYILNSYKFDDKKIIIKEFSIELPEEISKHKGANAKVLMIDLSNGEKLLIVCPKNDYLKQKESILKTISSIDTLVSKFLK